MVEGREILKVIERRAKIPEYLKENEDLLVKAICEFQDPESGKINYKDFVESLRSFNYDYANSNPRTLFERELDGTVPATRSSVHSMSSGRSDILGTQKQTKTIFEDNYQVLDS